MGYIQTEKDDGLVTAWITALSSGVTPQSVQLIDDLADIGAAWFRTEAPVRFGDLQNGTTIDVLSPLARLIYSGVPHFPFVVLGTKPHDIMAKNAKALGPFAFSTYLGQRIGGHVRATNKRNFRKAQGGLSYFKKVHHPGTKANDFPARAFDNAQPQWDNRINEYLNWFENP